MPKITVCGKVFRFVGMEVVKPTKLHWIGNDHHWTSNQEPRSMELEGGAHELVTTPWGNGSIFIVFGICSPRLIFRDDAISPGKANHPGRFWVSHAVLWVCFFQVSELGTSKAQIIFSLFPLRPIESGKC